MRLLKSLFIRFTLFIIILAVIVLLTGCIPGHLKVSINNTEAVPVLSSNVLPVFNIDQETGRCEKSDDSVLIGRVSVDKINYGKHRTMWSLSAEKDEVPLNKLEYGYVPKGFHELEKAEPLALSGEYVIVVSSGYGCTGQLYFYIK
ncbi:hypothetical protein [Methylomonas sp. AM2-LC]|uniref:hypothetical protein n=1 Tax=Methylomonas sp. AM2-LC TaxID=3153301 RepID=UPI00326447CF